MKGVCLGVFCVFAAVGYSATNDTGAADSGLTVAERRWFRGSVLCEVASAYLASSGALCDTRPVTAQELDWLVDLERFGWLDGYGWVISALHDGQHRLHRELFNEFEGAVHYGYSVQTSERTNLKNQFGFLWNPQIGYPNDNGNYWGIHHIHSYDNPYLTPYCNALWMMQPRMMGRIRIGVRHSFQLTDSLSATPSIETVWSDNRRYIAKYGEQPDHAFLGGGFATERFDLTLRWNFTESLAMYAQFRQFMVLGGQTRRVVRARSEYYAKTDLIVGIVGIEYSF